jgi:hypothetical protein
MPELLTTGALLTCSFGLAPMPFTAQQNPEKSTIEGMPVATIMEFVPDESIPDFVTCTSAENPEVIAAMGAPVPCTPVIATPWEPGSTVTSLLGLPAATAAAKCMCLLGGGEISVLEPAEFCTVVSD